MNAPKMMLQSTDLERDEGERCGQMRQTDRNGAGLAMRGPERDWKKEGERGRASKLERRKPSQR